MTHLGHVAIIVQRTHVVEQLQRPHQGLRGWGVHEVKVHLQGERGQRAQSCESDVGKPGMARAWVQDGRTASKWASKQLLLDAAGSLTI